MLSSVPSRRLARSGGWIYGASAPKAGPRSCGASVIALAPCRSDALPAPVAALPDDLLELLYRAMDENLVRAVRASERTSDLAVVHAESEAQ